MKFNIVFHLISFLLMILSVFMGVVALVSYLLNEPQPVFLGMLASGGLTLIIGAVMWITTRVKIELSRREGIGIVVFGWFFAALLGSLPFLFTGAMMNPFDAFFESCSGLTTTGASVMFDLENHSRAILLWRAMLHFLGGMGILVLVVAIIPYLGVGGMQIYRAEVTGPSKDRLTPRIASTAKLLWGVYILMNVVMMFLLKIGGMDWFDSVCHAFATISTGGFSTRTASIAAFDSVYIESVIIFFMLISGINFALHFKALRGEPLCYINDSECRFYFSTIVIALTLITIDLIRHEGISIGESIRHSSFYVVSLITTTGFSTVDYDQWPAMSKIVLLSLFVVGGCAGSTAGGLKQIRVSLLTKKMGRVLQSFLKPQAVYTVKLSGQIVPYEIILNVAIFFFIYMGTLAVGSVVMSFFCDDMATAVSAAFSAIGNIGPGFSAVGPMQNYAALPDAGKSVLALLMLIGRLEFYTLMVVVLPSFWRK
jgi:trk system potassium uptake protein TrkH